MCVYRVFHERVLSCRAQIQPYIIQARMIVFDWSRYRWVYIKLRILVTLASSYRISDVYDMRYSLLTRLKFLTTHETLCIYARACAQEQARAHLIRSLGSVWFTRLLSLDALSMRLFVCVRASSRAPIRSVCERAFAYVGASSIRVAFVAVVALGRCCCSCLRRRFTVNCGTRKHARSGRKNLPHGLEQRLSLGPPCENEWGSALAPRVAFVSRVHARWVLKVGISERESSFQQDSIERARKGARRPAR